MNWLTKISNGIPPMLEGLASEARKCSSFDEFRKNFAGQIKHGMYWHVTDDPNFFIDPVKGPIDASSMAIGNKISEGSLMITSHLEYWAVNYAPHRKYAALIDMSAVPSEGYKQVSRGFGNEFFLEDAGQATVIAVFPIKDALRISEVNHEQMPQNEFELKEFYITAKQSVSQPHPSADFLLSQRGSMNEQDDEWNKGYAEYWKEDELVN